MRRTSRRLCAGSPRAATGRARRHGTEPEGPQAERAGSPPRSRRLCWGRARLHAALDAKRRRRRSRPVSRSTHPSERRSMRAPAARSRRMEARSCSGVRRRARARSTCGRSTRSTPGLFPAPTQAQWGRSGRRTDARSRSWRTAASRSSTSRAGRSRSSGRRRRETTFAQHPAAGGTRGAETGTIVVSMRGELFRLPAAGGAAEQLGKRGEGERGRYFPEFLPEGSTTSICPTTSSPEQRGVYVAALGSQVRKRIVASDHNAPSLRRATCCSYGARRSWPGLDARRLELPGSPPRVGAEPALRQLTSAASSDSVPLAYFSVSSNGVLAWIPQVAPRTVAHLVRSRRKGDRDGGRAGGVLQPCAVAGRAEPGGGRQGGPARATSGSSTSCAAASGGSTHDRPRTWARVASRRQPDRILVERRGIAGMFQIARQRSARRGAAARGGRRAGRAEDWSPDGKWLVCNGAAEMRLRTSSWFRRPRSQVEARAIPRHGVHRRTWRSSRRTAASSPIAPTSRGAARCSCGTSPRTARRDAASGRCRPKGAWSRTGVATARSSSTCPSPAPGRPGPGTLLAVPVKHRRRHVRSRSAEAALHHARARAAQEPLRRLARRPALPGQPGERRARGALDQRAGELAGHDSLIVPAATGPPTRSGTGSNVTADDPDLDC